LPKNRFLSSYFGKSAVLQKLALAMIAEGRKDVLLDLNKAVKVLGSSVDSDRVIKKSELEPHGGVTPEPSCVIYIH